MVNNMKTSVFAGVDRYKTSVEVSKNGFKLGDSKEFSKFIKKKCLLKYQRNSEKL